MLNIIILDVVIESVIMPSVIIRSIVTQLAYLTSYVPLQIDFFLVLQKDKLPKSFLLIEHIFDIEKVNLRLVERNRTIKKYKKNYLGTCGGPNYT